MPRDRTGDDRPPDDLFSGPHPAGCEGGWIEEHYDAAGHLLGHYRYDPAYAHVERIEHRPAPTDEDPDATVAVTVYDDLVVRSVTFPCPRCRPKEHARWQARRAAGCYKPDHDRRHCDACNPQPGGDRASTST